MKQKNSAVISLACLFSIAALLGCGQKNPGSALDTGIESPRSGAIYADDSTSMLFASNGEILVARDREYSWLDTNGHSIDLVLDSAGNPERFIADDLTVVFTKVTGKAAFMIVYQGTSAYTETGTVLKTPWNAVEYEPLPKATGSADCGGDSPGGKLLKKASLAISFWAIIAADVAAASAAPETAGASLLVPMALGSFSIGLAKEILECTGKESPVLNYINAAVEKVSCGAALASTVFASECAGMVLDRLADVFDAKKAFADAQEKKFYVATTGGVFIVPVGETFHVRLDSSPMGVRTVVDGIEEGESPVFLRLTAGTHSVRFSTPVKFHSTAYALTSDFIVLDQTEPQIFRFTLNEFRIP